MLTTGSSYHSSQFLSTDEKILQFFKASTVDRKIAFYHSVIEMNDPAAHSQSQYCKVNHCHLYGKPIRSADNTEYQYCFV